MFVREREDTAATSQDWSFCCTGLLRRGRGRRVDLPEPELVPLPGIRGVLTVAGLLVQSGAIAPAASADRRALAWHAYLWDPWFLLWGALVTAALVKSRQPRAARIARGR